MPDRITRDRLVRLTVHLPLTDSGQARWALTRIGVAGGVPRGEILADGVVNGCPQRPGVTQVWELLDAIVRQSVLPS